MLISRPSDIRSSEITPLSVYLRRCEFLAGAAGLGLSTLAGANVVAAQLQAAESPLSRDERQTPLNDVTSYNNFYEFGPGKTDHAAYAHRLTTSPWSVTVDGLVSKPTKYQFEDFIRAYALEERVYRLRCVEGWSMVIPWIGVPLSEILKRAEPLGHAKYVAFESLLRANSWNASPRRFLITPKSHSCGFLGWKPYADRVKSLAEGDPPGVRLTFTALARGNRRLRHADDPLRFIDAFVDRLARRLPMVG